VAACQGDGLARGDGGNVAPCRENFGMLTEHFTRP
jgi:hypothetical protein